MKKEEILNELLRKLNKETTSLYKLLEEKNKLIKLQRHYICELLKDKKV